MESFSNRTPDGLVHTRLGLHRLAAYVIAPVRYRATERFGLVAQPGGFGTPEFDGRIVRVEGNALIDDRKGDDRRTPITTLRSAADFLGSEIDPETAAEHDTPPVGDVDADLGIDAAASAFLGDWFNMAFEALETIRADAALDDPSATQLWPGHFDPAIEGGDEDHRATFGASPGDGAIPEPYLYVSIWYPDRIGLDKSDPYWNASSFVGSILAVSDFPDRTPGEVAAEFWLDSNNRIGMETSS